MKQKAKLLQSFLLLLILSVVSVANAWGDPVTTLPVTYDFNETKWASVNFSGASGTNLTLADMNTENNHSITFHGSNQTEFSIVSGSPNALRMNSNGATNHFIAIPMSNINGRIDIEIWAPYAQSSNFTIRAVLDTNHETTVQSAAPSAIKTAALDVNDYKDGHFYFRMKDLTATEGVLYIGPASSSYKDFQKISVSTPSAYLVPDKNSLTMGDASDPETVTITNYSSYPALLKTVPSCVTATFDPSTGVLVVTPKSVGSGNIEFAVDTDGDGHATDTDLSIPVTVTGITIGTQPASAVYNEGDAILPLTISATNSGAGTLKYQWYKNTVNSTTGGEKVGSNSASYTPSLTAEANAFYYCEVSADGAKTKTTDVVYVLYSNTKRYFQMSNVAGNQQFSEDNLNITGQVIAGGSVTAIHGSGDYYRYITRPNTSTPHMYVTNNGSNSFRIDLDNAITDGDLISVLINGYLGSSTGIKISTDASCTENVITIDTEADTSIKTYTTAFTSGYDGKSTIYVRGIYAGLSNYFTDLIISTPEDIAITGVTPTSQTVAKNATASAFTVAHTGGNGTYSYQWYTCNSGGSSESPIGGATASTYTPSTSSVGTTYYKCKVTSNAITVTSSVVSCEVVASIDYYVIKTNGDTSGDAQFDTNGKYSINNLKSVYASQDDDPSNLRNYWYINNSDPGTESNYFDSNNLYIKDSRCATTSFYVKGAVGFKIITTGSDTKKYTLSVDGTLIGNEERRSSEETATLHSLNKTDGSIITIAYYQDEIKIKEILFYENYPNIITVSKNGETVTETVIYTDESNVVFNVEGLSSGAFTATSDDTGVVTVSDSSCPDGVLTLNPVAAGTATITIEQAASGEYGSASTTLNITVKKHTLKLSFSYDKASFKASALTSGNAIPSGSLPTLTATLDGEEVTGAALTALGIRYQSDEPGVGRFDNDASYTVTYGGDQGGARIYAYVDNRSNPHVNSDKDYFDLVVEAGTSNALPSTAKSGSGEDKEIYEQKKFRLANSQGVEVVELTYGGYKYAKENKWKDADKKGDYFIDGYAYYTRHELDAFDEYGYQIKGMEDEATDAASSAKSQYSLSTWSSQNVGNHSFWYTESEGYGRYERIRPFNLPTRGGYLKFEPKQTGKLTVYVWQNGTYSGSELGSKPRLGYWFDQDGWVQHPTTAPITKQPLSDNMGSNTISLKSNMDSKWTAENDDAAMKKLLINKWCSVANPNENTPVDDFSNAATKPDGWFENPYYWLTESEVDTNLDEDETVISKKMVPVPYHNGYMVPEASYLKYKLNVVAGKTYYFYGMMTKIGYVGMNFVEDESVISSFAHNESRHLNATDNMSWVSGLSHDYTVYDEVTLPSNYKKNQWSTICLPFALSESQVEEAFGVGTQLTLYNGAIKDGVGTYTVKYLSHVDRNILAGQPYFIKPSGVDANGNDLDNVGGVIGSVVEGADAKTRILFSTVCIDKTHFSTSTSYGSDEDVDKSGSAIDQQGYKFVGAYNNETLPKYSYVVSGGELRQFTGSTTKIPTYYAYLKPNTSTSQSGSYSLNVPFNEDTIETTWVVEDDDPTDVISMEAIADAMNNGKVTTMGKAYNMMGQEIDPTSAKGIVIINGKKYMFQ